MVSRRELLNRIAINLRQVRGQRGQVSSSIDEVRGDISKLKPATRETLPQRRFGAPVSQVKARQQDVLRRRRSASTGIIEREREIERLGTVEVTLAQEESQLIRQRKIIEDIPEARKRRAKAIEEGRLFERSESGELIPLGRELKVSIREIPPQQLGSFVTRDEIPKPKFRKAPVEVSERFLQNVSRFLAEKVDPQKRADRLFLEELNRRRFKTSDQFNKDVDAFNREFSGRELGEQEFTRAEKRRMTLGTRASDIEKNEAAALTAISDIEKRTTEKGLVPQRLAIGFATGIFTAIPATALLGLGLVTKPIRTVREAGAGVLQAAKSRPLETVGEILGGALVLEVAFRGITRPIRRFFVEPARLIIKKPIVPFTFVEVTKAVTPDVTKARFRITGEVPPTIVITQTKFQIASETLARGFTAKQGSLSRALTRRVNVIEASPEFRIEVTSGDITIRKGKIVSDAATLTVRQRGKISVQRLRGEVEPVRITLSDITKFDPAFKRALQAIAERTVGIPVSEAALPRVLSKLGKPVEVQIGRVITKDVLKTSRKGLKDLEFELVPEGRTIRRARITFTTKELKTADLKLPENVEFFESITALEDVTFPRFKVPKVEDIQTIRGITKFIDLPEDASFTRAVIGTGKRPLKKAKLETKLETLSVTKAVIAAAIPKIPRPISKARAIQRAEQAISKSPVVRTTTRLARTRFADQTKLATPEASLELQRQSAKLSQRLAPRRIQKELQKEATKLATKLTVKELTKQIPKLSTKLAQKLVTKLTPRLATKIVSKAAFRPIGRGVRIPAKTLIKPVILPRGELLPKPRKRKKKEFDDAFLFAPDISARAAGVTKRLDKKALKRLAFTGAELRPVPIP